METELATLRHQFESAQSLTQLGVCEVDLRTGKLEWSTELFVLFELDPLGGSPTLEELLRRIEDPYRVRVEEAIEDALSKRIYFSEVHPVRTFKNHTRWFCARGHGLYDAGGSAYGAFLTIQDVTKHVQVEQEAMRQAQTAVEKAQEMLRAATDGSYDSVFLLESERNAFGAIVDFRFVDINRNAEGLIGLPRVAVIGQRLCELLPINRSAGFFEKYVTVVETGVSLDEEFQVAGTPDGSEWLRHQVVRLPDGIAITTSDITDRKQAEQRLQESELFNQRVAATAPDTILIHDLAEKRTVHANRDLLQTLGYSRREVRVHADPLLMLAHPEDVPLIEEFRSRIDFLGDDDVEEVRFRLAAASGEWRWFASRSTVFHRNRTGRVVQYLSSLRDITEQRLYEMHLEERMADLNAAKTQLQVRKEELEVLNERLATLAVTDGLTGLNNHRGFQERIREELDHANRVGLPVALILTDVDNFKEYNDRHGHPAGDEVLKSFSAVLAEIARASDFVARYGGEEFAVILPSATAEDARRFCERLQERLKKSRIGAEMVTASFGCADSLSCDGGKAHLIAAADRALYRAKREGKNRVAVAPYTRRSVSQSAEAV